MWRFPCGGGIPKVRITALGAMTGTAVVSISAGAGLWPNLGNMNVNINLAGGATIGVGAGTSGSGTLRTTSASSATAVVTTVADQATNITLLAAATTRLGARFVNDSTEILYGKYGATATTDDWSFRLYPGEAHELPGPNIYAGIVDGIWANDASGKCRVTSW